jgi:triosephosphate isomerase
MYGTLAESVNRIKRLGSLLSQHLVHCDIVLCPPFTLLRDFADHLQAFGVSLGAQDCHYAASGAHTGDISAEMLADLRCRYVIIGHSERRSAYKESNELIAQKVLAAHRAGLIAIVCVGETAAELKEGRAAEIVEAQILNSLPDTATEKNTILAYEPVWAIGAAAAPAEAEIQAMHVRVLKILAQRNLNLRVIYGGAVSEKNVGNIVSLNEVAGVLVGRASLDPEQFWSLIQAANTL